MPRPRFNKLAPEKRESIMEAAAREFAAFDYEDASMNRILEQAGLSKGAAYYYFDDKADLFRTVADYYTRRVLEEITIDVENLTGETFWPTIINIYRDQFARVFDEPWLLAIWKATGRLSKEARSDPVLEQMWSEAIVWMRSFMKRGQALGAVRTDLPDDLLIALFQSVDSAADAWSLDHLDTLTVEQIKDVHMKIIDAVRRMLMPPE